MKVADILNLTNDDEMVILVSPTFLRKSFTRQSKIPVELLEKSVTNIFGTEYFGSDAIEISYAE